MSEIPSFAKWVNNKTYSDFVFYIGPKGTKFYAHKFILSSFSFFSTLFKKENITEITYVQIDPLHFYEVLHFIYTKTTSSFLDGKMISEVHNLATTFHLDLLKKLCMSYIGENSLDFMKSESFLTMEQANLLELLQNPFLCVEEPVIVDRCIEWAKVQKNPSAAMKTLLPEIRLTLIPLDLLEKLEKLEWIDQDTLLTVLKRIYTKKFEEYRFALKFAHQSDFDTNGIFYHIGTKEKTTTWSNPMTLGLVSVSLFGNTSSYGNLADIVGRANSNTWVGSSKPTAFQIDLMSYRVKITDYTFKHFTQNCCFPRIWNLECSHDGTSWDVIQTHSEPTNASFSAPNQVVTFKVQNVPNVFYRHMRLINMGQNSSNWNFGIGALEIYGYLRRSVEQ